MAEKRRIKRSRIAGPGRFGTLKAVKNMGSSAGGQHPSLKIIRAEEPLTVRFLEEPENWFGYMEHYDPEKQQFVTCTEGECCDELQKPGMAVLASAFVRDDGKVMAVKMKSSLVEILIAYYEKWGTILDRDYELRRSGSGKNDTKYFASNEDRQPMNLSRYKPIDPEEVLLYGRDDEDESPRNAPRRSREDDYEDDDYEEDEAPSRRPVKKTTRKVSRR